MRGSGWGTGEERGGGRWRDGEVSGVCGKLYNLMANVHVRVYCLLKRATAINSLRTLISLFTIGRDG